MFLSPGEPGNRGEYNGREFLGIAATKAPPVQRAGFLFITEDNGLFWYWLFEMQRDGPQVYAGTVTAVMNSIRFPNGSSGRSRQPSTATPATDIPVKPLVLSSKEIAKKAFPSVVSLTTKNSKGKPLAVGTGFFVSRTLIATNLHVWKGASEALAKFIGEEKQYRITAVVATDTYHDLVLLRFDSGSILPLTLAKCDDVTVGERVYAVGNPEGLEGTFSEGVVSGIRDDGRLIQITAPISPGSSGGPVLNVRGEVIGVSAATLKGGQNLNFAIPGCYLNTLLSSISTTPSP